jgi:hypothetical protein
MPVADPWLVVACVAAVVATGCAAVGGWLVRGSTAVPAAMWATAAAALLAGEMAWRAAGGLTDPPALAAVRLVAAAVSLCPTTSLLGAKRPQHGVWQFIVATLAVVLALPAATATLVRPGTFPDVPLLVRGFMLVIVAVGWLNFAGTRRGLAATLVAAGQLVLLRGFLPLVAAPPPAGGLDAFGCLLVAAGGVLAAAQSAWPMRRSASGHPLAARIDPPWLAIRETLGAAWTLRIAERFNAIAASRGWPCRLWFRGLDPGAEGGSAAWQAAAERVFRALMRRFVSAAWMQRHAGTDARRIGPATGRG